MLSLTTMQTPTGHADLPATVAPVEIVNDGGLPGLDVASSVGMYFDLTLFGQEVRHNRQGVPEFRPHPLASRPDMSSLPAEVDFHTSGDMPRMIRYHQGMRDAARRGYGGAVSVGMRDFLRGPLDAYVQLRSYEGFVEDTIERPALARKRMSYFVSERARWVAQRRQFLGQGVCESTEVHDDWVNVPFISPAMFRTFVLPAYKELQQSAGSTRSPDRAHGRNISRSYRPSVVSVAADGFP